MDSTAEPEIATPAEAEAPKAPPQEGAAVAGATEASAAEAPEPERSELWRLVAAGDLEQVRKCLAAGDADPSEQCQVSGESVLMRAAAAGQIEMVQALLDAGAPWNALDRQGKCAGEHALAGGHQPVVDLLVQAGVKAELVLGALEDRVLERGPREENDSYLGSKVEYTEDEQRLMEPGGEAVMMEWERPLMQIHAQVLCQGGLDGGSAEGKHVLNVGFGMGIFDTFVQGHGVARHTIIEAHPQVHAKMLAEGWDKKPGVTILFGRWQDVIGQVADGSLDGAFFDTFGEHYSDMKKFHAQLPRMLKPGGLYSFFNGLCPRNIFFHGVACQVVQLELARLGLDCEFHGCQVEQDATADATWDGIKRRYWWNDTYYLPVARLGDNASD